MAERDADVRAALRALVASLPRCVGRDCGAARAVRVGGMYNGRWYGDTGLCVAHAVKARAECDALVARGEMAARSFGTRDEPWAAALAAAYAALGEVA
jgi:hypothetical protein